MNKQDLINGKKFLFSNEEEQFKTGGDQLRIARVWFDGESSGLPSWAQGFKIHFNGILLHSSKGFKSFKNRLDKLVLVWDLKPLERGEDGEPIFEF